MGVFTERRAASNPALIPPTGDRRRSAPQVDARVEEGRVRYHGRSFEQAERELARDYQRNRSGSPLDWRRNRHAARAAWERFDD